MRLFIAVPLAEEIRQRLQETQTRLMAEVEPTGVRVKWVEPENFHLTVAFLGELSEASVTDVTDACAAVADSSAAFRVGMRGVSVFPKTYGNQVKEIKTIWAGVSEGTKEWRTLIERAEPYFVPFGAAHDGGLAPHITLGRVKTERGATKGDHKALRDVLHAYTTTDFGTMMVQCLTLMESTLAPHGATYREISRREFGPIPDNETK